jgi:hypothetical protein
MKKLLSSLLALGAANLLIFAILATPVSAASWISPIALSNSGKMAFVPSVAISNNGKLHAAWTEWTVDEQGFLVDFEIYYASSTSNGASWGAPVNISSSPNNFSGEPVIAIAGDQSNEIHIAWEEYDAVGGGTEVFYTRSTDNGVTWSSSNKRNVSSLAGPSGSPQLYVDSTASHGVHITWSDYGNNGYGQIHYSRSADGGSTFSTPLNVSSSSSDTDQPYVIADSTAIHIAWQSNEDRQIYYARSTNNGTSFSTPTIRSNTSVEAPAVEPAIALDGQGRVHIVWTRFNDAGGSDISWTVSSDNGATFAASTNRTNTPTTVSQTPTIYSPGGGRVDIIWSETNVDGTTQNRMVESPNGGSSWQASEAIAGPGASVFEPSLVIKGSTLYLVWEEGAVVKFSRGS